MRTFQARLHSVRWLATNVLGFELRSPDGSTWEPASPGSHIDLHLPNGLSRSYSLTEAADGRQGYRFAVHLAPKGRGGSAYLHQDARVGQFFTISEPRNHFPLSEVSSHSVLIAGGIGITPILSMMRRLVQIGAPWTLYYAARNREAAAFVDQAEALAASGSGTVHLNFDDGQRDRQLDLRAVVGSSAQGAHFYCCGPAPMLQSFESATAHLDQTHIHREYFAAPTVPDGNTSGSAADNQFTIHLAKSGQSLVVPSDKSILDVLLDAGVETPYSCFSGICGACATSVLSGVPDHRDMVLTDAERAAGKQMLICCSRAKTPELTLDM